VLSGPDPLPLCMNSGSVSQEKSGGELGIAALIPQAARQSSANVRIARVQAVGIVADGVVSGVRV